MYGDLWYKNNAKVAPPIDRIVGNNLYIKEKVDLLLYKTINTSEYNKLLYLRNIEELEYMGVNLNSIQTIYTGKVVLLNNQYEVKLNIINYPIYHDETDLNLIKFYNGIKAESLFYNGKTVLNLIKESSDCILYEGDLKKKNYLIFYKIIF